MPERLVPTQPLVVEDVGDDELCLYRPDVDEVLVLNATAADIWRLVDGETDVDSIARLLAAAYGTDSARVHGDVRRAVSELQERGFLHRHPAP